MEYFGIEKGRQDLGPIVNRAHYGGEAIGLTRNGKPVAVVVSQEWFERAKAALEGDYGTDRAVGA